MSLTPRERKGNGKKKQARRARSGKLAPAAKRKRTRAKLGDRKVAPVRRAIPAVTPLKLVPAEAPGGAPKTAATPAQTALPVVVPKVVVPNVVVPKVPPRAGEVTP